MALPEEKMPDLNCSKEGLFPLGLLEREHLRREAKPDSA